MNILIGIFIVAIVMYFLLGKSSGSSRNGSRDSSSWDRNREQEEAARRKVAEDYQRDEYRRARNEQYERDQERSAYNRGE